MGAELWLLDLRGQAHLSMRQPTTRSGEENNQSLDFRGILVYGTVVLKVAHMNRSGKDRRYSLGLYGTSSVNDVHFT